MEGQQDLSRIKMDTVQDWHRIKANFTQAVFAALDEELTEVSFSSERDTLRQHVQQFIDRTVTMMRPNIRVNGRNFEEINPDGEEEETFDEGFDRHIWSLANQSLEWDREIAEKRRAGPRDAEKLISELLARQREVDEELTEDEMVDEVMEDVQDDISDATYANIQQVALEVNAITEEVKQSVPLQAERSERVQTVAAEIKVLKP